MPIIGNPIYQSAFVVDQFSGNGSTTAFTMSVAPAGVTNVLVAVSGVLQDPSTYGVVGNTITFSAAPPSGTGNISCRYLGVPVTGVTTTAYRTVTEFTATASQTTFTPPSYSVGFINVYLNGVLLGSADYTATNGTTVVLAVGASAGNLLTVESFQISSVLNALPQSGGTVSGTLNLTSLLTLSGSAGTAGQVLTSQGSSSPPIWSSLSAPSVSYLVIAGGGAGGGVSSATGNNTGAGGGGAGGYRESTLSVPSGTALTVTVGAGGAGTSTNPSYGGNGSDSVFSTITSVGGGGGGAQSTSTSIANGRAGGSGGGGGSYDGSNLGSGGSATSGQGSAGGGGNYTSPNYGGGGGGGASAVGVTGTNTTGGNGGAGTASSITGSSVTRAGGGGGGTYDSGTAGTGANGGGNGSTGYGAGSNATANTGSGGGGAGGGSDNAHTPYVGGNGGSGIVIISYPAGYKLATATGTYTQTTSGGNYIFTFTGSGTITF